MSKQSLQQIVQQCARHAGFHLSGISPARLEDTATDACSTGDDPVHPNVEPAFPELSKFPQWVAEGRAGEMEYLKRQDAEGRFLRSSVQIPFPWVRSVIVCGANYNNDVPYSSNVQAAASTENPGWIARYAWSGSSQTAAVEQKTAVDPAPLQLSPTDYHLVMRRRLEQICVDLKTRIGDFETRCFVDTGPLVERVYAKYAGLGWEGKNTCLINESMGSWFFLGVILTSLELPQEERVQPLPDRCGSCTRCIDACPTQALTPYWMDASRCISYLTIEKRGPIQEDLEPGIGRNVFGCDICQEVCPWNRRAPVTDWPEFQPRPELINPALEWLENLDEGEYRQLFRKSAIDRAKYVNFQRNVAIAQRNVKRQSEQGNAGMQPDASTSKAVPL